MHLDKITGSKCSKETIRSVGAVFASDTILKEMNQRK